MRFAEGFSKVAVSMGWIQARQVGGMMSRMKPGGPRIGDAVAGTKKLMESSKTYRDATPLKDRIMDTVKSLNARTHLADLSPTGREAVKGGNQALQKAFPKSG